MFIAARAVYFYDAERLVVSGDEEIDGGPHRSVSSGNATGRAAQRPDGLEIAEEENDEGVGFCEEQKGAMKKASRRLQTEPGSSKKIAGGCESSSNRSERLKTWRRSITVSVTTR